MLHEKSAQKEQLEEHVAELQGSIERKTCQIRWYVEKCNELLIDTLNGLSSPCQLSLSIQSRFDTSRFDTS